MTKITENRRWLADDVRTVCIQHDLYTRGTNEAYAKMLEKVAKAMGDTAKKCGIKIVAGDTKVAGKGQVDKIFITTTAVGNSRDEEINNGKTSYTYYI